MVSINSCSIGSKILNSTTSTSRRYTWLGNTYPAELEAGSEPGSSLTDHLCRTCTANTRNIVMQLQRKKKKRELCPHCFFFFGSSSSRKAPFMTEKPKKWASIWRQEGDFRNRVGEADTYVVVLQSSDWNNNTVGSKKAYVLEHQYSPESIIHLANVACCRPMGNFWSGCQGRELASDETGRDFRNKWVEMFLFWLFYTVCNSIRRRLSLSPVDIWYQIDSV